MYSEVYFILKRQFKPYEQQMKYTDVYKRVDTVKYYGTVKYYAQIHLQVWQNSVCTGQGNLPLITQ